MSNTLYRKYRPRAFDELVGQEHTVKALRNALAAERLSHAYLFSGPRGVGKTTAARLLAAKANQLPIDEVASHLDIIEIDAASNRRIDEIRDLRDKVHIAPAQAKYKVYIVDEVHMLTLEAFNALLKTLEEPPEHVIFILATTEINKLPPTIVSRTQHFRFRPIEVTAATKHLAKIAKLEKLKIADPALEVVALAGEGSLRDSIGILDQLIAHQTDGRSEITEADVRQTIGWAGQSELNQLAELIIKADMVKMLPLLDKLAQSGVSPQQLISQLLKLFQHINRLALGIGKPAGEWESYITDHLTPSSLNGLIKVLSEININSSYLQAALEAALVDYCLANSQQAGQVDQSDSEPAPAVQADAKPTAVKKPKAGPSPHADTEDAWLKVLMNIKQHSNTLYTLLRSAECEIGVKKVLVKFRFQFHLRRLNENGNRRLLETAIASTLGEGVELETVVVKPTEPTAKKADKQAMVDSVLQIFGGEIVK